MKRFFQVLALLLIIAAVGYFGHGRLTANRSVPEAQVRAPVVPGAEFVNVKASADYYREQILRHPDVVRHYVELAQLMLQRARVTADEGRYIPEARDLLDEALRRDPENYHALFLKATLLTKLHRFEDARVLAEQLIDRHEDHAYNYGTLVDALVELGRYDEAVAVCDSLISLRPGLPSYARASYLRELHGDTDGAIAAMYMAADAGVGGSDERAWALFQLGNLYLGANKPDTAAYVFNGILEEVPGFTRALGGLAHVHLVKGEHAEALALLEEAYAEVPAPYFLEHMAEAYQETGDTVRLAATVEKIKEHFRAAEAMGETIDMEYADFLVDQDMDLEEALARAQKAYLSRPTHLHALETYAWALYKNGRAAEAVPYIKEAMRLGTGDAMVHYRAGMIYHAAGNADAAQVQFGFALAAHLHIESRVAAEHARTMRANRS
jgi:pentatricopeptide repeat protein